MKAWIESRNAKKAVIVGGGFIGLEMAENLSLKWFFSLAFTQRPGCDDCGEERARVADVVGGHGGGGGTSPNATRRARAVRAIGEVDHKPR